MPFAIGAYLLWGVFPAFFPLLLPASPLEILAHRIIWTAVLIIIYLVITGTWRELTQLSGRTWLWLSAASVAITINWGTYVLAVNSGHVADAALGYFINPLVSVALGVIILKEQLRKLQLSAVGVAAVAVLWLTFMTGEGPWISLLLAASFGIYGLLKKQVNVSSAGSVAAETLVMSPVALIYIGYLSVNDQSTFLSEGPSHTALLVVSGLITALPLILFAQGAKLLPLSTIGMLQYVTPTMQLLWAVFVTQEHMSSERWIGFVIIWFAVALYMIDLLRIRREARRVQLPPTVTASEVAEAENSPNAAEPAVNSEIREEPDK
ncbi:EamA family transporter RarD [Corynebacterium ammoniagenes]|uniref:Permease n=2 Tax=Corynebacterium ammoniagenes TaxID=1697 RepID=A0AAV5G679_CORAM|nr:EamA family transporter RarD [Corynebacterium ammoniagenes]AQS73418.1 EamA family transporter [Corynebacterium ammoniagenes]EFG82537.1 protein RarD [Corynebacterium ammoniagenes DSM 20306]NMF31064.1 EamA family transporter RarD [Corynebacterium ammoniagenes]GJN42158.1 permease [Corynebacterium ammoniagenes]